MGSERQQGKVGAGEEDLPCRAAACSHLTLNWDGLVPVIIHPIQVAILEAMAWLERPVSSKQLERMFEEPTKHYLSAVSYHMRSLAKRGAVEETGRRPIRGVRENCYFLAPAMFVKAKAQSNG